MERRISPGRREDAIDWFTRELERNPSQAEHLKQVLRRKMGLAPEAVSRPVPIKRVIEDPDDYWDNVPV